MVHKVLPIELAGLKAANPNIVILDVREADEREISVIPGAIHIPMAEIGERMGELDPEAQIIVHCRTGGRSGRVSEFLVGQGFKNVSNLETGINGYAKTVDPEMATY